MFEKIFYFLSVKLLSQNFVDWYLIWYDQTLKTMLINKFKTNFVDLIHIVFFNDPNFNNNQILSTNKNFLVGVIFRGGTSCSFFVSWKISSLFTDWFQLLNSEINTYVIEEQFAIQFEKEYITIYHTAIHVLQCEKSNK